MWFSTKRWKEEDKYWIEHDTAIVTVQKIKKVQSITVNDENMTPKSEKLQKHKSPCDYIPPSPPSAECDEVMDGQSSGQDTFTQVTSDYTPGYCTCPKHLTIEKTLISWQNSKIQAWNKQKVVEVAPLIADPSR